MVRRSAVVLLALAACPGPSTPDAGFDAGADAGTLVDAGSDAGSDAGVDAGAFDAGVFDAGPPTAGMCGATDESLDFGGSLPNAGFDIEVGSGVAVDALGTVALTGTYHGAADFGGGALSDPGANPGMFVTLLGADGGFRWSRGFADPSGGVLLAPHADGLAVARASNGDVLVGGAFAGIVDFGLGAFASADPLAPQDSGIPGGCLSECATDIVVLRLNGADGTTRWARQFGGYDSDSANAVALDVFGNVYVAGAATGAVDFGDAADAAFGGRDVFLLALDGDGGFLWQRRFGGTADDVANALAVDDAGFVLGGVYQETVDFGGGVLLTSFAIPDAFAVRLDPSGQGVWGAPMQVSAHAVTNGLALDSQGAVWVAGTFRGTADAGLGGLSSVFDDGFVTKLSPSGAPVLTRRLGGTLNDAAFAVAIGPADHPFITGNVAVDTIDFGGGPLTGGAGDDFFLLELDASGAHQCSRRYPSQNGGSSGRAIAVDALGTAYVTGDFFGTVAFGREPMTAASGTDIFFSVFANR